MTGKPSQRQYDPAVGGCRVWPGRLTVGTIEVRLFPDTLHQSACFRTGRNSASRYMTRGPRRGRRGGVRREGGMTFGQVARQPALCWGPLGGGSVAGDQHEATSHETSGRADDAQVRPETTADEAPPENRAQEPWIGSGRRPAGPAADRPAGRDRDDHLRRRGHHALGPDTSELTEPA